PAAPSPPDAAHEDGAGEVKIVLRDRPPGATETQPAPPSSTASVSGFAPPHAGNSARPEIRRALSVLCEPAAFHELRMLGADGAGIKAGFFDDLDALAATAAEYDGRAKGIYVTLNPVNPELLTRHRHPRNALGATVGDALTSKADVLRRRWMLLD